VREKERLGGSLIPWRKWVIYKYDDNIYMLLLLSVRGTERRRSMKSVRLI
jgi:hypothetical protein